jgi:hypothetical protein
MRVDEGRVWIVWGCGRIAVQDIILYGSGRESASAYGGLETQAGSR